jgi:DNA helicase-2/ATP-dependent DNA helicase PcrA
MRSRFLKELSSVIELPQETRPMPRGYSDWDDPDSYGNSAYGGGRYASNDDYGGRRNSFGGSYGGYSNTPKQSSTITRTPWNGNSYGGSSYGSGSYGSTSSTTYGSTSYGGQSTQKKSGGFVYGGVGKAAKPATGGKDLSVYKIGVSVKHPKFGVGVIVAVRGMGSNMFVDIAFEGLGIKQLSASLAPLTVI